MSTQEGIYETIFYDFIYNILLFSLLFNKFIPLEEKRLRLRKELMIQ